MNDYHVKIGRAWVKRYFSELKHYGVKGMKWGVRRTPEQLGHKRLAKSAKDDTIVRKAVKNGEISLKVNREKQLRHTKAGHIKGRSYLNGDLAYAQKLVNELSGTGKTRVDEFGRWNRKERVSASEVIGYHVDLYTGKESRTNKAIIVYSRTGTHIYPAIPPKKKG